MPYMIILSPPMEIIVDAVKIKKLVAESKFKPEYIAESAGIQRASLRQLLNGNYNPSRSVIKLLAMVLDVPETELYKQAA